MTDLSTDFFFEGRLISYLQKILRDPYPPSAITQVEVVLRKKRYQLQRLDTHFDGQLIEKLREYSKFILPKDAIFFLLEVELLGETEKAKEILDWAVVEKATMTYPQLFEALKESENMPTSFLPTLYGEYNEDGRKEPVKEEKKSSIDVEALKRLL